MHRPFWFVLLAILAVVASSLACTINLGGAKPPTPTADIPTETSEPLDKVIETSVPETGDFNLTITEAQLTDLIKQELAKQDNPVLENPSVVLRDGVIELYGTAKTGILTGNVHLVVDVTIDDQGNPQIKIKSADIGGVPVPSGLLSVFSGMIEEGLTSNLGAMATGFRLTEIHIADGVMVVKGVKR